MSLWSSSFSLKLLILLLPFWACLGAGALVVAGDEVAAYRQKLKNVGDAQYSGEVTIGGQKMRGIFDTGSFEVIAMSTKCKKCKAHDGHPAFNAEASKSFLPGSLIAEHTFGSGPALTAQGFDDVAVGPMKSKNQTIWEIMDHMMDVLDEAAFEAIIGIGPGPKEPTEEDKQKLGKGVEAIKAAVEAGVLPKAVAEAAIERSKNPFGSSLSDRSLLESFGVTRFSVCLQQGKEEPGWLIWSDEDPRKRAGFVEVPVIGQVHWGVKLTQVALKGVSFTLEGGGAESGGSEPAGPRKKRSREAEIPAASALMQQQRRKGQTTLQRANVLLHGDSPKTTPIACASEGCAAVIDSGTSLMAAPSHVLQIIEALVDKLDPNCDHLEELPTFLFQLGGKPFELPPEAYVGRFVGVIPPSIRDLLFFKPPTFHVVSACVPLFMELDKMTQFGEMWILGMPFFRHYYTTFETEPARTLHMAKAKEDCTPQGQAPSTALAQQQKSSGLRATIKRESVSRASTADEGSAASGEAKARRSRVMHIDASKIRIPAWAMPGQPREVNF